MLLQNVHQHGTSVQRSDTGFSFWPYDLPIPKTVLNFHRSICEADVPPSQGKKFSDPKPGKRSTAAKTLGQENRMYLPR